MAERMKPSALPRPFYRDWFLGGMAAAVVLATLFPEFGRSGGPMHADVVSDVGIALVFFLHGLGLSIASLRSGVSRWKVHLLVQTYTFVVFPLLWLVLDVLAGRWVPEPLRLGFFFLCALPSTISSSVAMTAVARGNVPAAIFNATVSSLLGVFLTPLLVSLLVRTSGGRLPLSEAIGNVAQLVLLPLVLGQLAKPLLGRWFARYKQHTAIVDRLVVLLLVYASFSDSVASGLWSRYGVTTLGIALAGTGLLLAVVLGLTTFTARRLGFPREDEIVAVFCGSKKTLASGVPMARLLFGAHAALGLIVLPIMFYHQLQLAVGTVLAGRYARKVAGDGSAAARPDPA
jgi:solute carrier family 10 (sodium/bile acid cotransporter), member 7